MMDSITTLLSTEFAIGPIVIHFGQLFFQLAIFLAAVAILNRLVFRPLLVIRQRREEATVDRERSATLTSAKAEEMKEKYSQQIGQARHRAHQKVQEFVEEGQQHRKELLGEARREGQDLFTKKKSEVEARREELAESVRAEVGTLAEEVYATVLE